MRPSVCIQCVVLSTCTQDVFMCRFILTQKNHTLVMFGNKKLIFLFWNVKSSWRFFSVGHELHVQSSEFRVQSSGPCLVRTVCVSTGLPHPGFPRPGDLRCFQTSHRRTPGALQHHQPHPATGRSPALGPARGGRQREGRGAPEGGALWFQLSRPLLCCRLTCAAV